MSLTSHPDIPLWVQNRIVGFFNTARNVDMILDGTIRDDPADGHGKVIGPILAARILRERNQLPRRRFTDLEQIDQIKDIGPGTLQDLVYSFGKSADEAFVQSMYGQGTIYQENWPLEYFRYSLEDEEALGQLAFNKDNLRRFVSEKVREVALERQASEGQIEEMGTDIAHAHIDSYSNSSPIAGYALALWFYHFDADNWFSWETIQEQTIRYFDHNSRSYPSEMELFLLRSFTNRGIIQPGIAPDALPVVLNWAELTCTFWISALYD